MKAETKKQEKERMLAEYKYYQKPNREIDCVMKVRRLRCHVVTTTFYGSSAAFILSYMRRIHKCSLLPVAE